MLFNSKQLPHQIKFTSMYSLIGIKDLWKAVFMYSLLISGSDQNTSSRRAHNFSEGGVLLKAMLATLILKCKSSTPILVLILQVKLIYHLHATPQRWRPGRRVWRYFSGGWHCNRRITTSIQWIFYILKLGRVHLSLQLIPLGLESRRTRISQSLAG